MSNKDKIWLAIEKLSGRYINALHGESKVYTFRYLDGTWKTIDFDFANDLAGFGPIKRDLL